MVCAQQLAVRYERYATVLDRHYPTCHGRGELAAVRTFMAWIESFWGDDAPPEPTTCPDAISIGPQEAVVRWYDAGSAVLGYATDLVGCYRVPVADAPPAVSARPAAST